MEEKRDIIDEFEQVLMEDLIFWTFEKEVSLGGQEKLRIFSKKTDNKGKALAGSEINFRIQCFLEDISPEVAFNCMSDSNIRSSWDPRMSDIKRLQQNSNEEVLQYYVNSTMPFVSHRDVVARKQHLVNYPEKNNFIYAFSSCEMESCPEGKNHVRS